MRNLILIAFALLLTCSCSKDETEASQRGSVTFKVDNVSKTYTKLNSFNEGVLALANSRDELVSLFFPKPTSSSTYPITYDMSTTELITASYLTNGKTYNATNGLLGLVRIGNVKIIITSFDTEGISGSFELTLVNKDDSSDSVVITEGLFSKIPSL